MAAKRILSIIGATGQQGSSVLRAVLKDGTFTPRALTRTPDSEASLTLKARGVDVVKADTSDASSLLEALRGSEGVFAATLSNSPDEVADGKRIVDASKAVGVKFFVFSSVPGITTLSGGKMTQVKMYDDKEAIENYLKASGLGHGRLRPKPTGGYNISFPYPPNALHSWTWVHHDVGQAALALFKSYLGQAADRKAREEISGKAYPVVTANLTFPALVEILSKGLGVEVTFTQVETTGMDHLDKMIAAQAAYDGFFADIPVPNPALVALGAEFGTVEEFVETEVKKRFGPGTAKQ
ncbi:hypothetical protein FB45DRAFT_933909 [Roridomyces roridus]|uniref:NmrA-like domain-containing protein n=1 Tax=Roridomyces roridus TaxID=1738132 RepID=A0AAD7FDE4_9AGAR|nr:hypothetical protein FB45DRAFT_933909 [Roridomyces roridus]